MKRKHENLFCDYSQYIYGKMKLYLSPVAVYIILINRYGDSTIDLFCFQIHVMKTIQYFPIHVI